MGSRRRAGQNHLHKVWEVAKSDGSWFHDRLTVNDTHVLSPTILDDERRHGMPEALVKSEYLTSFDAAQIGSVYGDLLEQLAERGRIEVWETKPAGRSSRAGTSGWATRPRSGSGGSRASGWR